VEKLQFLKGLIKDLGSALADRDVVILLLLGPIVLTLIFGGVYINAYVDNIPIAILDEDNSSLSRMIVRQFEQNDRFKAVYYAQSREDLNAVIESGKAYMGLFIPENFSRDVSSLKSSPVLVLVDGTNIVVGNNSFAAASSIIQTISAGVQIEVMQAKGLMPQTANSIGTVLKFTDRTLYDPGMKYMNYLLLGFIAVFLQQVVLAGVGISVIKASGSIVESGKIPARIISKILACSIVALSSTFIAVYIATTVFGVPFRGSLPLLLLLSCLFAFAVSSAAVIISSIVKDKVKYAQLSYMLSLPTFVSCGYIWPFSQMPKGLALVVKTLWPLANFARSFDEIAIKGLGFSAVKHNITALAIYTAVLMPVGMCLYKLRFGGKESHQGKKKPVAPEISM